MMIENKRIGKEPLIGDNRKLSMYINKFTEKHYESR